MVYVDRAGSLDLIGNMTVLELAELKKNSRTSSASPRPPR